MNEQRKFRVNTKTAVLLGGLLLLACAAGIVLFARRSQVKNSLTGGEKSIPVSVIEDAYYSSDVNSGKPGDRYGIDIQLGEGQAQIQTPQVLPQATGEPLSPEEIERILSRLPSLPPGSEDQAAFNFPQESLPPPRPGETIEENFPPLETEPIPGTAEAGPLQVLRFAPEGEIPIAPFISVTFNQPMVPLGTVGDLAAGEIPLQIRPTLPGTWRWLGTKTLTFEYDFEQIDRLPKATEYQVIVPAGTKSMNGAVLGKTVSWTFKTPPPKVVTTYPDNSPQPLHPILFVAFDQRIDPAAVLKTIQVKAGSKPVSVVLANKTEIEEDEQVSQLAENSPEGRWLAFKAEEAFPPETNVSVTIGPGTPSVEGPLITLEAQSFSFLTYTPLRIKEHSCSWYDDTCPPLASFYIRFNNLLDTSISAEELLTVEPDIPGVSANLYGDMIVISGQTKGQTNYTVTVSGKFQDIFGQQLGRDARLTFKVGRAEPIWSIPVKAS